jgi:hypothetical protein
MAAFTFHVEQADKQPLVRTRDFDGEGEAMAYAEQLLADWADSESIDVLQQGHLLSRLRRRPI